MIVEWKDISRFAYPIYAENMELHGRYRHPRKLRDFVGQRFSRVKGCRRAAFDMPDGWRRIIYAEMNRM